MHCQHVYSVVIFSHRFLDSDCINFKTFAFLAVYWPFWTSLIQHRHQSSTIFLNPSSTMLNNVFKSPYLWIVSLYTLVSNMCRKLRLYNKNSIIFIILYKYTFFLFCFTCSPMQCESCGASGRRLRFVTSWVYNTHKLQLTDRPTERVTKLGRNISTREKVILIKTKRVIQSTLPKLNPLGLKKRFDS